MTDWDSYRNLFPVVNQQTYFMTAGAGALPSVVYDAIVERYKMIALYGGKVFGENLQILETCREKIAIVIGAEKDEIAFIPNVSFGMNAIAHSLPSKSNVLLSEDDFSSSLLPWKNTHHSLRFVPHTRDLLNSAKSERFTHVVASHVNFAHGYKLDLEEIKASFPHASLIVNGTQALGAFPLNVKTQKIDALICSCYKWLCCGEGIAFMYINPDFFKTLKPKFVGWRSIKSAMNFDGQVQLHDSARVFELGWDNMTIFSGLDSALNLLSQIGIANITERIVYLNNYLIRQLIHANVPIQSDINSKHSSGITLLGPFNQQKLNEIVATLERNNIWTTQRNQGIRISLHYYNNEEDIDHLISVLMEAVR